MSTDWIETGSFTSSASAPVRQESLHVVCWNIARGCQISAITEFLVAANADLILLQESDRNTRRTGDRNVAKELAQTLGMNYAFGVEFQNWGRAPTRHRRSTDRPRFPVGRCPARGSSALAAKMENSGRHNGGYRRCLHFKRRLGGRMALVTQLAVGNVEPLVYNLHLESRNGDELRLAQLTELLGGRPPVRPRRPTGDCRRLQF